MNCKKQITLNKNIPTVITYNEFNKDGIESFK